MPTLNWTVTITTAGIAEQGPDCGGGTFKIVADPANGGTYIYVGNDGSDTITSTTGVPLAKTNTVGIVVTVGDDGLQDFWFDTDNNGDKVHILKIEGVNTGVRAPAA
jgi:hypothetical protein